LTTLLTQRLRRSRRSTERFWRTQLIMGCLTGPPPSPELRLGIYRTEREKHKDLPSHYIYTACEDASERLSSFEKLKRRGRAYTDKPSVRKVTVHLDDHLWKFGLDRISISIL